MSKFQAMQRLYEPWLINATIWDSIKETIVGLDVDVVAEPIKEKPYSQSNGIAVLSLKGTMMKNPSALEQAFIGATCTQSFTNQVNEIRNDPNIMGVILDVDSGGGSVQGVIEASDAVRELHKIKPVVTYTDGLMASASYWVGSQATAIVASPSARVGSIGVYVPVADYSENYSQQGIEVEVISNKDGRHNN